MLKQVMIDFVTVFSLDRPPETAFALILLFSYDISRIVGNLKLVPEVPTHLLC